MFRARTLLVGLSVFLMALVLLSRTGVALGAFGLLDWDETYYASTTATAAHGLGFYPYVDGYPQIPDMGGVGYVIALYVLAYKLIGPVLFAPRLVSVLASLVAVAGLAVWTRRLYGSTAGVVALALTPSLLAFQLTNSIRLDVLVVAFVAWALVAFSRAAERPSPPSVHALVGLLFACGLEVHLHTASAACAVGLSYLWEGWRSPAIASQPRWERLRPLAFFVSGYAVGVALFVAVNVLPNPEGYFRTAALARLSAADSGPQLDLTARMDTGRLADTFFSPVLMLRKERARYSALAGSLPWWEGALWCVALLAVIVRPRRQGAVSPRVLLAGAVVGGAIVFNGPSPLYASALLPFFVPVAAATVAYGFRRPSGRLDETPSAALGVLLVLSVAIVPSAARQARHAMNAVRSVPPSPPAVVVTVRGLASDGCVLAGPTGLYAEYFMAYPRFVGTRSVEVKIGSTYYDMQDDVVAYWREKRPDVVFGPTDRALSRYLADAAYQRVAPDVWLKASDRSAGCHIIGS